MGRRWFVFVVFLGAALILGGCVFGGGDGEPEVTATAEVTASVTVVATSEATAVATPGGTAPAPPGEAELPPGLEAIDGGDAWTSLELSAGDVVPDGVGVFLFDTAAGSGAVWSLDPDDIRPDSALVRASPNGTVVVLDGRRSLLNTVTGQEFGWAKESDLSSIDDRGTAVLLGPQQRTLWVVDLTGREPELVARAALPSEVTGAVATSVAPDASEVLVIAQGDGIAVATRVYSVDLGSGAVRVVGDVGPAFLQVDAAASNVDRVIFTAGMPGTAIVVRYSWSDHELVSTSIPTGANPRFGERQPPPPVGLKVSPDGRWVAWQAGLGLGRGFGIGGFDEWPRTVIANVEDQAVVLRGERVAATTGSKTFDWLADSSALVVQSEAGFALLGTDGTLTALPFPVVRHFGAVPVPAPGRADWFAYDGQIVGADGAVRVAVPAAGNVSGAATSGDALAWWNTGHYGWGMDSGRLILLKTDVVGRGLGAGGIAPLGLGPRIVTGAGATPAEAIELRVGADGDRLNARRVPGLSEDVLGQFADGTVVTVAPDENPDICGPKVCSFLEDPELGAEEGWWIYVTGVGIEGELAGWVSAEFVEWAE